MNNRGIIILDPGHGQFGNPHTTRAGFYEGTQNFILASFLKAELEALGFDIRMTRNKVEDDPGLAERGSMSGDLGAVMFLSIHSNAPGGNPSEERYPKVRGAETFYSVSDCEGNAPIARDLTDAVVRTMGTEDRGIKTRRYPDNESVDYYGVLRSAAASAASAPSSLNTASTPTPRIRRSSKTPNVWRVLLRQRRRLLISGSDQVNSG